ncbi:MULTISPECIES: cytochrome oxidase putative small subunit CydP [Aquitalea]|uniref:cytochrome oxidase putative small subunit CydP n=1 Tax=Aquitalea TaxID=407217 RepID=UPI00135BBD1F|nr:MULTISPECIES: cytochrome oxidase putative small subunit CydP [Aquitalea]
MKKTPRKLSRELAWIIGIKVVLLLIIWKAFVAPNHVHVDAASVADNMLDAAQASQHLEKNNAR